MLVQNSTDLLVLQMLIEDRKDPLVIYQILSLRNFPTVKEVQTLVSVNLHYIHTLHNYIEASLSQPHTVELSIVIVYAYLLACLYILPTYQ